MTTVQSVTEYLTELRNYVKDSTHGKMAVYRGQRDCTWSLVPKIARFPFKGNEAICSNPDDGSTDKSAERRLLIVLRDYGVTHFSSWVWHGRFEEVRWKQIVIAQHYRLPTRLLDWTTNPLAALYFAVSGTSEKCRCEDSHPPHSSIGWHDASVFVLKDRDTFSVSSLATHNERPPLYDNEKNVDPGMIRPPEIDGRISAQGSIFSIRKNPLEPIQSDLELVIPSESRRDILKELDALGVNTRTMFPDMEGVTEYLTWSVQFWEPNPGVEPN